MEVLKCGIDRYYWDADALGNLDLIDVFDNEFMMYGLTSLDSSSSNCDEGEDLNTYFLMLGWSPTIHAAFPATCAESDATGNLSRNSGPNSFSPWRELNRHINLCPSSALCPARPFNQLF